MKMKSYLSVCLLIGAGICFYACGSTRNSSSSDDSMSGPMQANAMPPKGGRPDGPPPGGMGMSPRGGMPPSGGMGMPPGGGMPPSGGMPPGGEGMMPPGRPGGQFDENLIQAVAMVTGGELVKEGEEIRATEENQSAVAARNDSRVVLRNNMITTSGNTTSQDHSSFEGLNAGVLGRDNAEISSSGNRIVTSGLGANAIFAHGRSVISSVNDVIICTGDGGHGIMCSGGGTIYALNVDITTSGKNAAPVATDRGSGLITVNGGRIVSHGQDSPGLYSTGQLSIRKADIVSDGSEVAVIEGSNSIRLDSCRMTCSYANKWGIMIYQSFSGDAEGADGEFEATRSAIHVTGEGSPLFFVTNSTAYITLSDNDINCTSGVLLNAAASRWGNQGENGGTAVITARKQTLEGDLLADADSRIRLSLTDGSVLKGTVNPDGKAKSAEVRIGKDSRWELSQDAYVSLIEADITDGSVANIVGNGHDIYYDASQNPSLEGKTYSLPGGGELKTR